MRRAARTDGAHRDIVAALRKVGCAVADTARAGNGFPDLLVLTLGGRMALLEVKTPGSGRRTLKQARFAQQFPVHVVHSIHEALTAVGVAIR